MFKKVLVANRGEIAVRIIRACKVLGIETVAIYSTADKEALHVQLATHAVCVGGPQAKDSYLNIENILSAATLTGCDGIHPGFGFLSENSKFARLVEECGITFIGPRPDIIDIMGNKSKARETMMAHQVPTVPGSKSLISNVEEGLKEAVKIGYPVLIKAANGGGGKGMRIAFEASEFENAFHMATSEAKVNFGDEDVYLEKYVVNPKHIEFQIIGDNHGNYVHLYERDCSIQRNHQKVIEEAPCRALSSNVREKMAADSVKAARAIGYNNVGTIEFIVDADENYYFIEMNTRIQVEHPITEMITGIDIIKEQLRVASGHALSFKQEDVKINGYAIECRINAEDPDHNFRPCPGKIEKLIIPGGFGVRFDSHVHAGYTVTPNYDSMVGKLLVHQPTRPEAIDCMRRCLNEFKIEGIKTSVPLQLKILEHPDFQSGKIDTGFIERNFMS